MWKQLQIGITLRNVHNLNMNEYNLADTFFLYFVMQSRLKALSIKYLKEERMRELTLELEIRKHS